MNAKWFIPLSLIGFAAFVAAAKFYLASIPNDVVIPPSLVEAQRIYPDAPLPPPPERKPKRVFRARPRALEPLPAITKHRPRPELEPIRPDRRVLANAGAPPAKRIEPPSPVAVALAVPPKAVEPAALQSPASAPPAHESDTTVAKNPPEDSPTGLEVHDKAAVDSSVVEADAPAPPILTTSAPAPSDSSPTRTVAPPASPPDLAAAVASLAKGLDDAAVRLRSNLSASPAVQLAAGYAALQSGRYEDALAQYDAILDRRPNHPPALSGRAEALIGLNRFDDAAETYARLMPRAEKDTTARYNYGVVLYRLSRYAEAADQFRRLTQIDPDHAEGQYNLATLAQRDGRLSEAQSAWQAFTRLRPEVAGGWYNLGIVLMDYDRPEEAVACFKKVVSLDQNDADARLNLAMAHLAADQPNEALAALEAAGQRLPNDRVVLRYQAEVHARLAENGGPDGDEHRRQADALRAKLAALVDRPTPRNAVATDPGGGRD